MDERPRHPLWRRLRRWAPAVTAIAAVARAVLEAIRMTQG